LIFNINPLLRFDGYYILSDLLEIPNLNQRAIQQLRHLGEHYLFGVEKSQSPAANSREAGWFTFYGVASGVYRVVVFSGVLFTVADRFLIIGLVMGAVCLISWVTVPVIRFVRYLANDPQLDRVRARAVTVTACGAAVVLILLGVVPFPAGFRAPGVVVAAQRSEVANQTGGVVEALLVRSGSTVKSGQPLLRLRNPELEADIASSQARLVEVNARLLNAMQTNSADLAPLTQLRDSVDTQLKNLFTDQANLVVRAPHDGIWVAPGIEEYVGREVNRGSDLGLLVNPAAFEFIAGVRQEDVEALFGRDIRRAGVRLNGDAGTTIPVAAWRVIPGEQKMLPSAALGWKGGGDIPVEADDTSGSRVVEPFFEVVGKLDSSAGVPLMDGRSGRIRFALPAEPLLPRWIRDLWQLLQKRYQV
jgi:putative peptide zinc metalloprotease protein